jgi:hypothetical protein
MVTLHDGTPVVKVIDFGIAKALRGTSALGLKTSARKAAGGVLTAKQAPHRPGTAPALGLRAGRVAATIVLQTACFKEQLL